MYTYIYTFIYIYIYIHICIHTYIHIYTYTYTYTYIYTYTYTHVYIHICMYIYTYVLSHIWTIHVTQRIHTHRHRHEVLGYEHSRCNHPVRYIFSEVSLTVISYSKFRANQNVRCNHFPKYTFSKVNSKLFHTVTIRVTAITEKSVIVISCSNVVGIQNVSKVRGDKNMRCVLNLLLYEMTMGLTFWEL